MNHEDHVNLLRRGIDTGQGTWADFGSGSGAFTLALAELLAPEATIHSVDHDQTALARQERRLESRFPQTTVHYHCADYTHRLDLPTLEGIVMANALHFQRQKEPVVELLRSYLGAGGRLILVEYNTDSGNRWVPYPISYETWSTLSRRCGFTRTELLATRPSRFLGQIYSALSTSNP